MRTYRCDELAIEHARRELLWIFDMAGQLGDERGVVIRIFIGQRIEVAEHEMRRLECREQRHERLDAFGFGHCG